MINIINTSIEEVKIIEPKVYKDSRGLFFESFNQKDFFNKIGKINFIQDNESKSSFGILRGMHYQIPPFEQSKLVRVISGEIQDIAIDIRKNSPTYLKYVSVILNDTNRKQVFIPKGFAHGFLVLSEEAVINYKVDNYYNLQSEKTYLFNDKKINIEWRLDHKEIKLSKKDKGL